MKTLNKIKNWISSFETIKTLNYRMVSFTPFLAILSTMAMVVTVNSRNEIGTWEMMISLLITLNLILSCANRQHNKRIDKLINLCKEHSNVIYIMIVITTFQMLSIWVYNEPKMMIPQSAQSMVLIALPIFKWCVFIHVTTLSRLKQTQGEVNV
ncbi:hypothetical protein [Moritella viscosa]|uniref:hypothetical protein n=1 Tax=Moritella viscosa TaxID=80854 RepID=UPI00091C9D09|nr:hypothetical protein [Moritella viscosa]SGZ17496.1 Putative type VI secretion protein VasR [Moritella viscosa]